MAGRTRCRSTSPARTSRSAHENRVAHPGWWQEVPSHAHPRREHQSQPERGRRVAGERERREPAILGLPLSHRLPDPEPETEGEVEQQDRPAQEQGRRQALGQELGDRARVLDGRAQVAAHQAAEKRRELGEERPVQTVARDERRVLGGRQRRARALTRQRVTGENVGEEKEQDDRQRQCEEGLQGAQGQPARHPQYPAGRRGSCPATVHSRSASQGDSGRMRTFPNRRATAYM